MPWDERTRMDQRVRFIGALESCRYMMTEACRAFGISRKTGYKWALRFGEEGLEGLRDRSRAPGSRPGGGCRCQPSRRGSSRGRPGGAFRRPP